MDNKKAREFASSIQSEKDMMCMFAISTKKGFRGLNLQIMGEPREFDPEELFTFFNGVSNGMGSEINCVINLGRTRDNQLDVISKALGESVKKMIG